MTLKLPMAASSALVIRLQAALFWSDGVGGLTTKFIVYGDGQLRE